MPHRRLACALQSSVAFACNPLRPLPLAVLPLDEIALAIAGLNGPDYASNPTLAYYLSLLRLVALVRPSHMRPLLMLML